MNLPESTLEHLRAVAAVPDLGGDRYQIVQEIGRGGMGVVYQVHDLLLQRDVAVKVLSIGEGGELAAERLRREARTLARLEHPGIVSVHDAGTLPDGRPFYAMKLVQGLTIAQRSAEGGLAERLRLFLRICEPVEFAHSKQIIHRDLKPANIMVGPFGEVLVMDWGIARALVETDLQPSDAGARGSAPGTADGVVIGTPGFMAPEQAAGRNDEIDPRTDVWSLGAVLRFLVEGVETDNRADWRRDRKPLSAILTKAMADDPADRYGSVDHLATDVRRLLDGEQVSVHRPTPVERLLTWGGRNQAAITVVAAYLLMRLILFLAFRT